MHPFEVLPRFKRPAAGASVRRAVGVLALVFAGSLNEVSAGVVDTPLPRFADGRQSGLIMIIPGVVKRGRLQTDFVCTSLDASPVDIGVEIFDASGVLLNSINAGVGALIDVQPGTTVTIGTSGTASYLESTVIPLAAVAQGSARVVSSSDRVECNVMVLDDGVTPPISLMALGGGVRPAAGSVVPGPNLPRFSSGRQATHSALIPGLIKRGRVQTDVFCTSLATESIDVGVEVFGTDGTLENSVLDGNGAALSVAPGATVTFGTTGTAAFLETNVIATRGVSQGFARVVSTSGEITCAAAVVDSAVTPPVAMSGLFSGATAAAGDANHDGAVNSADFPALIREIFR